MKTLKRLIYLGIFGFLAYGLWILIKNDNGYVLFAYKNFRMQSSLWAFLLFICAIWLFWILIKFAFRLTFKTLGIVNPWSRFNKSRRMHKAETNGLIAFAEGKWSQAAKQLEKAAKLESDPVFLYIDAAKANQNIGNSKVADELIAKALEIHPELELALGISQAGLQFQRDDLEQAQATLENLNKQFPQAHHILSWLLPVYQKTHNATDILKNISDAYKFKVLPEAQLREMEIFSWKIRINESVSVSDLANVWNSIPSNLKQELSVLYAHGLIANVQYQQAEEFLRKELKRNYDAGLMHIYATLNYDAKLQLNFVEKYGKDKQDEASVNFALALFNARIGNADEAKNFFEKSLKIEANSRVMLELAHFCEMESDIVSANQALKRAIYLLEPSYQLDSNKLLVNRE